MPSVMNSHFQSARPPLPPNAFMMLPDMREPRTPETGTPAKNSAVIRVRRADGNQRERK